MGPILIFDKSTLHGLSVDEALWLDTFFFPNITPLFLVETLADLEKEMAGGRTPEQVVGGLAEKTPTQGGGANAHHARLYLSNLLGGEVLMDRCIVVAGGRRVELGGRHAVMFEDPPEMEALRRWQEGDFLDVERRFARSWRRVSRPVGEDVIYFPPDLLAGSL